jgi:AcrR family transcriptional regulator
LAASTKRVRHRREPDTLDKILIAGREEFSEKGLTGAQMNSIARRAGVSKQVVYYYFGSKDGVYEAVLKAVSKQCLSEILAVDYMALDPVTAVRHMFGLYFDFYLKMPFLVPLMLDVNFHHAVHVGSQQKRREVFNLFGKIVDRGIADGFFDPTRDKVVCFSFAILLATGNFHHRDRFWTDEPEVENTDAAWRTRVLDAVVSILAGRGLPTEAPQRTSGP